MPDLSQFSLKDLIQKSASLRQDLKTVYDSIPPTRCLRRLRCCSLLPEMTFLEALQVLKQILSRPASDRSHILKKIVRYFFSNAAEISTCPFLKGQDCVIYPDRFFGCRAYGLWSNEYYENLVQKNRQGKLILQQQWEKLGLTLPEEVVSFETPYCSLVKPDPPIVIRDEMLSSVWDKIESLSQELNPLDNEFRENYFSDLSYFLVAWQFGTKEAVRLKYFIVRDRIQKGDKSRLDQVLDRVIDIFHMDS